MVSLLIRTRQQAEFRHYLPIRILKMADLWLKIFVFNSLTRIKYEGNKDRLIYLIKD